MPLVAVGAVTAVWLAATGGTNWEPDGLQAAIAASYIVGFGAAVLIGGWLSLPVMGVLLLAAHLAVGGPRGVGDFVIEAPVVFLGMTVVAFVRAAWRYPRPAPWGISSDDETARESGFSGGQWREGHRRGSRGPRG